MFKHVKKDRILFLVLGIAMLGKVRWCLLFSFSKGIVVHLSASHETRSFFAIEEFGFLKGGTLNMTVADFKFSTDSPNNKAAFLVIESDTENNLLKSLHLEASDIDGATPKCPLDDLELPQAFVLGPFTSTTKSSFLSRDIDESTEGLYEISFVKCGGSDVEFQFYSELMNAFGNHLSAGETPTPMVLFLFSIVFFAMTIAWSSIVKKNTSVVHKVHHMMTVFLVLKTITILTESIDLHFVKTSGSSLLWNSLYHLMNALRGMMFFLVVIMIGTGWSLLKPALNEREKKFLLLAMSLQLMANVVLAIQDYVTEGSSSFFMWRNIFQLIDLGCCIAVILPIFSHIQHLEKQGNMSGKVQINLAKLRQFRRFYLMILVYVYFTRIIIYLIASSVNFRRVYVRHIFRELAAVIFFCYIGYGFRPAPGSTYLSLPSSDGDYDESSLADIDDPYGDEQFFDYDEHRNEFGLIDGDIELKSAPVN